MAKTDTDLLHEMYSEQQRLLARVANLEVALHGMWAMLQDLQPPATQEAIGSMMSEHFEAMRDMGAGGPGGPRFERA